MNLKSKLLVIPAIVALSFASSSVYSSQSDLIFDEGSYHADEKVEKRLSELRSGNQKIKVSEYSKLQNTRSQIVAAAGTDKVIDVAVFLHESYIDALKEQISKRDDGAFVENGAQYALARAESHIEHVNAALAKNNVDVTLNIMYIGSTDVPVVSNLNRPVDVDPDHAMLINCSMFSDLYEPDGRCDGFDFTQEEEVVKSGADVIYFIRPMLDGEFTGGFGTTGLGATFYDNYVSTMKSVVDNSTSYSAEDIKDVQFGLYASQVAIHEFGHVFGGKHQISDSEPKLNGELQRDYACGNQIDPLEPRAVFGDLNTMRKTALWHAVGRVGNVNHGFYSDPTIEVDGFKCGVEGESDNASFFRANAGQYADNATKPQYSSDVSFALASVTAVRSDDEVTLKLTRSGDLSKPALIAVTARDGTAWEGRDFQLGLNEIRFAENEAEKTIVVDILPRSDKHLDTVFAVEARYAVGANIQTGTVNITIQSNNVPEYGVISFENSSVNVSETSTLVKVLVKRSNGLDGDLAFTVATSDSTAKAGSDYEAVNKTFNMAEGVSSLEIPVAITNRTGDQGSRDFKVTISNLVGGGSLGVISETSVTITNVADPVVTPPVVTPPVVTPPASESGGGGSTGLWMLLSLSLIALRRRNK